MPQRFMKNLYLLLLTAILPCCSLVELPPDNLLPTSGGKFSASIPEENPDEAWGPHAGTRQALPLRPLEEAELGGDLGVDAPFPDYNRDPVSPAARIFLVAGSASDASHLQEIVVLRDYWLGEGYKPEQIACHYVKPEKADYEADRKRFDSMATRTQGFYLAAPHVLFRHLKDVAKAQPSMISLYVSGAGKAPSSGSAEEVALAAQYPEFAGCYRIVLRGGPSGHMNERMRLEALRDGIDGHYLLFNAEFLAEALNGLPASCEKYVVLNGDHSGGFVTTKSGDDGMLRKVPGITVLASARHDRTNMAEGGELSQFGGLYLSALSSSSGTVESRKWRHVANELIVASDKTEQHAGVRQSQRCRPVFFSSLTRESGPAAELASELAVVEEAASDPVPTKLRPTSGIPNTAEPPKPTVRQPEPNPVSKKSPASPLASPPVETVAELPEPKAPASPRHFQRMKSAPTAKPTAIVEPVVVEALKTPNGAGEAPKAVVSPRPGSGLGMGRPGFGH